MRITSKIESTNQAGITIGNFDGVHRGHQSFLASIRDDCRRRGVQFSVVTFVPHPLQILSPKDNYLINTYMERREFLRDLGVDNLIEIEFNRDVSTLEPGDFLDEYIIKDGAVKVFYAGFDFAFGTQKSGDHKFLKEYCNPRDIELVLCDQVRFKDEGVSSSFVREQIVRGHMPTVADMLGRKYFISGTVVRGEGRGKMIGIPTINIQYSKQIIIPPAGVYVSQLEHGSRFYPSITNVGDNPTFGSGRKTTIETHVLDFDETIYGDAVRVHFIERIRDEKKFESAGELVSQINKDIASARVIHEAE